MLSISRSREGAWIEISARSYTKVVPNVAPARERGLKFTLNKCSILYELVAPARERGLKSN